MFPIIAPTRFGPLARKTLGRRYTKAEGDNPPKEPEAPKDPKAEKPKGELQISPVPEPLESREFPTDTYAPNFPPQVPYGEMVPPGQVPWEGTSPVKPPTPLDNHPEEQFQRNLDSGKSRANEEESEEVKVPHYAPIQISFFQSIKEDLDDNTPRLIYADWLEDNSQPDLAEAVRIGVEHSSTRPTREKRNSANVNTRRESLRIRLQELENSHPEWFRPWSNRHLVGSFISTYFDRGMLEVSTTIPNFNIVCSRVGSDELALANVSHLHLKQHRHQHMQRLFYDPSWLQYVPSLSLADNELYPSAGICHELAHSGYANNLKKLNLANTPIDDAAVAELTSSEELRNLRQLNLSHDYNIDDRAIALLINAPYFNNLQELTLLDVHIGSDLRRALRQRYGNRIRMDDFEE